MGDELIDLTEDVSPKQIFSRAGRSYGNDSIATRSRSSSIVHQTVADSAQHSSVKSSIDVLDELIQEESLRPVDGIRKRRIDDRSPTPPARRAVLRQESGRKFLNNIIACTNSNDMDCPFSRMLRESDIERKWRAVFPDDPLISPSDAQCLPALPAPPQAKRSNGKAWKQTRSRAASERGTKDRRGSSPPAQFQAIEDVKSFAHDNHIVEKEREGHVFSMRAPENDSGRSVVVSSLLSTPTALETWLCYLQTMNVEGQAKPPRGAGIIAFRGTSLSTPELCAPLQVCLVEKARKWTCAGCGKSMYDTWVFCSACREPRANNVARCVPGSAAGGFLGYPKGGQERVDKGCVLANALREWDEETGISHHRLRVIPNHHFDDGKVGVRFLLAICIPDESNWDSSAGPIRPTSWTSPEAAALRCPCSRLLYARYAAPTAPSCHRCRNSIVANTVYLTCDSCNYSLCASCQDPDPILMTHWMQVDHARKQMAHFHCTLLDAAIAALRQQPSNMFASQEIPKEKCPSDTRNAYHEP